MNADLIPDLEIIRDKLTGLERHAKGNARDCIACARRNVEFAIREVKEGIFKTPYSERNDFPMKQG